MKTRSPEHCFKVERYKQDDTSIAFNHTKYFQDESELLFFLLVPWQTIPAVV